MDAAGMGSWGSFGQLVTVVAAALAAVYIIVDNVRRTNEEEQHEGLSNTDIISNTNQPIDYPPTWGIFGRAFQSGRPYFGSRSPLRSIWDVRDDVSDELPLVYEEEAGRQTRETKIDAAAATERSPLPAADGKTESKCFVLGTPLQMDPAWFGDRHHDNQSILDGGGSSRFALPVMDKRYLSDLFENGMDAKGNDVTFTSGRCISESHARLQRLLDRDMERQSRKAYPLWSDDGDRIREMMRCGRQKWLEDIEKDWEQFNIEVLVENDQRFSERERMPAIPEKKAVASCSGAGDNLRIVSVGSTPSTSSYGVEEVAACSAQETEIANRHQQPLFAQETKVLKQSTADGVYISYKQPRYREFSMPRSDSESSRQIPLLSNGDDSCLLIEQTTVDDSQTVSPKIFNKKLDRPPNEINSSVTQTTLVVREITKRRAAMSPNKSHPGYLSDATSSEKDIKKFRTVKPPLPPPLSLPIPNESESSRRQFKARQQFFESLSKTPNQKSPDSIKRFKAFQQSTREERYRLASSAPNLKLLETYVQQSFPRPIPLLTSVRTQSRPPAPPPSCAWPQLSKKSVVKQHSKSIGYLETDIDTFESRTVQETSLTQPDWTQSMLTVQCKRPDEAESKARSVDYLSDVKTSENNLGRAKSDYEIRVEKSLQNLHIPDWYKHSKWSQINKDGFLLKRRREKGWQGFRSKTTSTLSMTNLNNRHVTAKWGMRSAGESPTSSTGSLSRWSSAKLSTASGPVFGWNTYRTTKQPYLGWRASSTQSPTSSNQSIGSTPTSPDPSCDSSSRKVLRFLGQEVLPLTSLQDVAEVIDKNEMHDDKSPGTQSERLNIPRDRYSYIESIFNSDSCIPQYSGDHGKQDATKIVWIESSFVGSRATTSVAVMKDEPALQNGTAGKLMKTFKEERV